MIDEEIPMIMEREAGLADYYPAVAVGFGLVPCQNGKKSSAAGHPVFEERIFVKIAVPGDKQSLILQPATQKHMERFPRAYEAFKARESEPKVLGMPIEQWPQITRSQALTLKAANIFTVEALAGVHDGNVDKIGSNGREMRAKAQAFLDVAKNTAAAQAIAAENEKKDLLIADMQRQIAELARLVQDRNPTVLAGKTVVVEPQAVTTFQQNGLMAPPQPPQPPQMPRRGRPPGSKNKPKTEVAA